MSAIDFSKLTIDDLMRDPKKYGLPTYEEYVRTRDKWWGRDDAAMTAITDGPQAHRQRLRKIIFKCNGVELSGAEEAEKALSDHGFSLRDIDLENRNSLLKKKIEMVDLGGGKYDVVVDFMP